MIFRKRDGRWRVYIVERMSIHRRIMMYILPKSYVNYHGIQFWYLLFDTVSKYVKYITWVKPLPLSNKIAAFWLSYLNSYIIPCNMYVPESCDTQTTLRDFMN